MTKHTREIKNQQEVINTHITTKAHIKKEFHTKKIQKKIEQELEHFKKQRVISHSPKNLENVRHNYLPNKLDTALEQPDDTRVKQQIAKRLAESLGFNTKPEYSPCVYSHLFHNRTDANYECLINFRAIKYYPIALIEAMREMNIEVTIESNILRNPLEYTLWELTNLSINNVLLLRELIFKKIKSKLGSKILINYIKLVEKNRLETMGTVGFFADHWKLQQPVVLVSSNTYNFWDKAMRQFGFGSASLIKVATDSHTKIDINELERILEKLHSQNIPVLAVIGTLGTSEFGSIDPIHSIIKLQQQFAQKGLNFYTHINASNTTYFIPLFKDKNNQPLAYKLLKKNYTYFPSKDVYQSFLSLNLVDSITVTFSSQDNYLQGISCFIINNRNTAKILNDSEYHLINQNNKLNNQRTNSDTNEEAHSEAPLIKTYLDNKIQHLNANNFRKIAKQSLTITEHFYKKIIQLQNKLNQLVKIDLSFKPETNVLGIIINPISNQSLSQMNRFLKRLQNTLNDYSKSPLGTDILTSTIAQLDIYDFSQSEKVILFNNLQLTSKDIDTSVPEKISFLKYTFAFPCLLMKKIDTNDINIYCNFLEEIIRKKLNRDS